MHSAVRDAAAGSYRLRCATRPPPGTTDINGPARHLTSPRPRALRPPFTGASPSLAEGLRRSDPTVRARHVAVGRRTWPNRTAGAFQTRVLAGTGTAAAARGGRRSCGSLALVQVSGGGRGARWLAAAGPGRACRTRWRGKAQTGGPSSSRLARFSETPPPVGNRRVRASTRQRRGRSRSIPYLAVSAGGYAVRVHT